MTDIREPAARFFETIVANNPLLEHVRTSTYWVKNNVSDYRTDYFRRVAIGNIEESRNDHTTVRDILKQLGYQENLSCLPGTFYYRPDPFRQFIVTVCFLDDENTLFPPNNFVNTFNQIYTYK